MTDENNSQLSANVEIRQLLLDPTTYPVRPPNVELIETHISCVFVAGDSVYKLKKPVHFEFVDFSTSAARHTACQEELRLNRRLAHDVYIDVLPITRSVEGRLALAGAGEPVDWVVHMRRLPIERTLDAHIRARSIDPDDIANLSHLLGDFYVQAERVAVSTADYRREIEHHVRANRADLLSRGAPEHHSAIRRVHAAQLQFLLARPEVFDARVQAGRIIDGHGDLRPEHICLTRPPVIFDCLEFDPALRRVDVADELSFLAMECERLGDAWIGQLVRAACLERCTDNPPRELLAFYQSYRACVRAKVAALRAAQMPAGEAATTAADEAVRYLQLAAGYAPQFARPLALVVSGLMGSGKSTLARALAETLGAEILSTDAVRHELFGASAEAADFNAGSYTPENRRRVYDELFARARALLHAGENVVLDGTFLDPALLHRAAAVAQSAGANLLAVRCACPDEVALQRIAARQAAGNSLSEARPELYQRLRAELQPIPDDIPHVAINTTREAAGQIEVVIERLRTIIGAAE